MIVTVDIPKRNVETFCTIPDGTFFRFASSNDVCFKTGDHTYSYFNSKPILICTRIDNRHIEVVPAKELIIKF